MIKPTETPKAPGPEELPGCIVFLVVLLYLLL